jgi:hypothetical protein
MRELLKISGSIPSVASLNGMNSNQFKNTNQSVDVNIFLCESWRVNQALYYNPEGLE